jgi:hypothetical protein
VLLWVLLLSLWMDPIKTHNFSGNSQELSFHEAILVAVMPQFTFGLDA